MNRIDLHEAIQILREDDERRRQKVSLRLQELRVHPVQHRERTDTLEQVYGLSGEPGLRGAGLPSAAPGEARAP